MKFHSEKIKSRTSRIIANILYNIDCLVAYRIISVKLLALVMKKNNKKNFLPFLFQKTQLDKG